MNTTTRRIVPLVAAGALVLAACGSSDDATDSTEAAGAPTSETEGANTTESAQTETSDAAPDDSCASTIDEGTLTFGTGEPAFFPWVIDDEPESGEGFESAVAYAVAAEMGYEADAVTWVRTSFDEAIQPGAKSFDLNMQQYTINDERDETIDFSLPYYTSNQAIVALGGSAAEGVTTLAELKDVQLGAQSGTTSLTFITDVIQPTNEPLVYNNNADAKAALEANQIDAAVFDLSTANYVSSQEIENSSVIGQFSPDAGGTTDQYGMVMEDGNPLKSCVDAALTALTDDGTIDALATEWLPDSTVPFIAE